MERLHENFNPSVKPNIKTLNTVDQLHHPVSPRRMTEHTDALSNDLGFVFNENLKSQSYGLGNKLINTRTATFVSLINE